MRLLEYFNALVNRSKETPLRFVIEEEAIPKGRPRFARGGTHAYTPERTRKFEALVADHTVEAMKGRKLFTAPVGVNIKFVTAFPRTISRNPLLVEAATEELLLPSVGDLDNLVKAITDGMNGIAYVDDRQIRKMFASHTYGPYPSISVEVFRVGLSDMELSGWLSFLKAQNGNARRRP